MRSIVVGLLVLLALGSSAMAQKPAATTPEQRLRVAVLTSPPFSWRDESGFWQGIAVALWAEIAQDLKLSFDLVPADMNELITGVAEGRYAAGIGALSVTPDREEAVDFTHPFFTAGLGMAVRASGGMVEALRHVPWKAIGIALSSLLALTMLAGLMIWFAERRSNPDQFGGPRHHGVGAGIWWAAVTLTTVGYGDKAPISVAGRAVAVLWMLASLILTASFTATITSALTVNSLNGIVNGPSDLPRMRVGAVTGTSSVIYLNERRIAFRLYPDASTGLRAVADGEIDAFVADKPLLQFRLGEAQISSIRIMPHSFGRQDYSFAIPNSSPLRPEINKVLLRFLESPTWTQLRNRYLREE